MNKIIDYIILYNTEYKINITMINMNITKYMIILSIIIKMITIVIYQYIIIKYNITF